MRRVKERINSIQIVFKQYINKKHVGYVHNTRLQTGLEVKYMPYVIAAIAVAAVGGGAFAYFKKRNKK